MKAENSGEINVFLCQDNSPESSPIAPALCGNGIRTATSTRLHHLTNQRIDPLFNNIDAMSTKGLGKSTKIDSSYISYINKKEPSTNYLPFNLCPGHPPYRLSAQRNLSKSIEEAAKQSQPEYNNICDIGGVKYELTSPQQQLQQSTTQAGNDDDDDDDDDDVDDELNQLVPTLTSPVVRSYHHHQRHGIDIQHILNSLTQSSPTKAEGGLRSTTPRLWRRAANSAANIAGNTTTLNSHNSSSSSNNNNSQPHNSNNSSSSTVNYSNQQRRSDVPMYNCAMDGATASYAVSNNSNNNSSHNSSAIGSLHMQFAAVAGNESDSGLGVGLAATYSDISGAGANVDQQQQYNNTNNNKNNYRSLPPGVGDCDADSDGSNVALQGLDALFGDIGTDCKYISKSKLEIQLSSILRVLTSLIQASNRPSHTLHLVYVNNSSKFYSACFNSSNLVLLKRTYQELFL